MSQRALVNHYFGSENCACLPWAQTVTVRSQDLRYKLKVHATTCIGLAIHHTAFMFAMSMAPQRPHRQWQVNANGRLNALFSMGHGVDGSQLGRYTKVKRVYIVQCTRNWLKHKLTIIFGYFILEISITVVTAKPFVNVGVLVLFIMSEVSPGGNWVNIVTYILLKCYLLTNIM